MTYSNSRIKIDEIVTLTQTYFSCNQGCFAWCNIHAMYEGCFIIYFLQEAIYQSVLECNASIGKCINTLAENSVHVLFGDSKLTRLLCDSFGSKKIRFIGYKG